MKTLSLMILASASTAFASEGPQGNQMISGFKFQTCREQKCIEVGAEKAWMSQLGFSFTTEGATTITVRDGAKTTVVKGSDATMNERLKLLVVDDASGNVRMFSLDELQEVGGRR